MKINKFILVVSFLCISLFVFFGLLKLKNKVLESDKVAIESFTPGTVAYKSRLDIQKEALKEIEHIEKGFAYQKVGKYDLAISEYLKAIEVVKGTNEEFVARLELSKCYEEVGEYELATKEIDWLLPQSNPEFKKELQERKERLLKLVNQ